MTLCLSTVAFPSLFCWFKLEALPGLFVGCTLLMFLDTGTHPSCVRGLSPPPPPQHWLTQFWASFCACNNRFPFLFPSVVQGTTVTS